MAVATPKSSTTIIEHCRIAPPPQCTSLTLPITFFDVFWLHFHPIQRLLFYQYPCSKSHFYETIIPNFKKSLSKTLQHFVPLAGNLIFPPNSAIPKIHFQPGDSVQLSIAESSGDTDLNYLTGNQPRDANDFYGFAPELSKPVKESDSGSVKVPLFAVQITLFPGTGISICFVNHHTLGDASSIVGFIKAWSSIAMLDENSVNDDEMLIASHPLPFYDRSVIKDPSGLLDLFWNAAKNFKPESTNHQNFPTDKIRATFILHKENIQKLRGLVQARKPNLTHLTPYTISTSYIWSCLAKTATELGEEVDDDEPECFGFAFDARSRLDPPVPAQYFGNCIGLNMANPVTHGELKGNNGFVLGVEAIGEVIKEKVNAKGGLLRDAKLWLTKVPQLMRMKRFIIVSGTPKFDLYDTEFGWGKPKKIETLSIDRGREMSLGKAKEFEGGLEIGLSLPRKNMDAFAAIFSAGLEV